MNKTGQIGERIAIAYLKKKGYKILERNFKLKCGEIDIIAKDSECVCFIEVKTRTSDSFAQPYEAVDYEKQKRLQRASEMWLSLHSLDESICRFDVVSVLLDTDYSVDEITIIQDAFWGG